MKPTVTAPRSRPPTSQRRLCEDARGGKGGKEEGGGLGAEREGRAKKEKKQERTDEKDGPSQKTQRPLYEGRIRGDVSTSKKGAEQEGVAMAEGSWHEGGKKGKPSAQRHPSERAPSRRWQ